MRTTDREIWVRVRVDNRSAETVSVRPDRVRALTPPKGDVDVTHVMAEALPLGEMYPSSGRHEPAVGSWIDVPRGQSLLLTLTTDHQAPAWDGHRAHRYRVRLARPGGPPLEVEASSDDAIRHRW